MFSSDEALTHKWQLDQVRFLLNGHPNNDGYFLAQAAEMHALQVIDAVAQLRFAATQAGARAEGPLGDHLVYGVGRRTGDIWGAMRELVSISPPDRTRPLTTEQTDRASRALNTIYINIRGTMDNFAWAVIERAGGVKSVRLSPTAIDLFGDKFSRVEAFGDLPQKLSLLLDWNNQVKSRRNPSAHRVPLAVIPAVLDPDQAETFKRLTAEMTALPQGLPDDEAITNMAEQQAAVKLKIEALGVYWPMFAHMPSEGAIPIYPTVAEDVGQMVRVGRIVLGYLGAQS